jgi:hypothetical protein
MTPMQLDWACFGYSGSYNLFMGLAKSAPLPLLSRRTMRLGSPLTVATVGNVVAVNVSYDVLAKMYTSAMLLMAPFLLRPKLSRLKRFFVDGDAVSLKPIEAPVLKTRRMRVAKSVVKFLRIGSVLVVRCATMWATGHEEASGSWRGGKRACLASLMSAPL